MVPFWEYVRPVATRYFLSTKKHTEYYIFCALPKTQAMSSLSWRQDRLCTANEGAVRIQFQCLVPIYVFPEMKLRSLLISKTEL
jgi:hypothetical protein